MVIRIINVALIGVPQTSENLKQMDLLKFSLVAICVVMPNDVYVYTEDIEMTASVGETVRAICPVTGNQTLPSWYHIIENYIQIYTQQDLYLINPALSNVYYASNKRDLVLTHLSYNESGVYSCSFSRKQASFVLDVLNISSECGQTRGSFGDEVLFNFIINISKDSDTIETFSVIDKFGIQLIHVTYNKGNVISSSFVRSVNLLGNISRGNISFTKNNITNKDAGLYRMSHKDSGTLSCITLTIFFPTTNVTLLNATTAVTVNENIAVTLACQSSPGLPISDIRWYIQNGSRGDDIVDLTHKGGDISQEILFNDDDKAITTGYVKFDPTKDVNGWFIYCTANNTDSTIVRLKHMIILNVRYPPDNSPIIDGQKNGSTIKIVEDDLNSITCSSVGGNPLASLTWTCFNGSVTYYNNSGKSSATLRWRSARGDDRTCTCRSSHPLAEPGIIHVNIQILFPPDVTMHASNVSVNDTHADVYCLPSGNPDSYVYTEWMQTWPGFGEIILPNKLGSKPTLKLTQLTYQHSGIYTCQVTNGVHKQGNTELFSKGNVYLLVQSFPIITQPILGNGSKLVVSTPINTLLNISVEYYSNTDTSDLKCYRKITLNGKDNVLPVGNISLTFVKVKLPVFSQVVPAAGVMAIVTLNISSELDYGNYIVVVANSVGESRIHVELTKETLNEPVSDSNVKIILGGVGGSVIFAILIVSAMCVVRRFRDKKDETIAVTDHHTYLNETFDNTKDQNKNEDVDTNGPYEDIQSEMRIHQDEPYDELNTTNNENVDTVCTEAQMPYENV